MENLTKPASSAGSSETLSELDFKGNLGESLEEQRSLVRQKEIELKEIQDQISSYTQMVKQLTSQREMAVKKLADMDNQIHELNRMLESERIQVEAKDKELKSKRNQIQTLKNEEDQLKEKLNYSNKELSVTTRNLETTQINETQIKNKLNELRQFMSATNEAIDDIEKAINYKDTIKLSALCDQTITLPPLSVNALLTNGMRSQSSNSPVPDGQRQHHASDNLFDSSTNFDPFGDDDPFEGDDPFKAEEARNLALPEDDPFNPGTSTGSAFVPSANDPFASGNDGF